MGTDLARDAPAGADDPDTAPTPSRRRKHLASLSTVVGVVIVGVAFAFVISRLAKDWDEVQAALADASPLWVAVGFAGCVLGMTSIGWTWADTMGLVEARQGRVRTIGWYFVGELGKYLPGGIWPVVGRGELARRGGVARGVAYASVALSLVLLYLAAMLVGVAVMPFALGGDGPGAWALVLLLLPLGLVMLHPKVMNPCLDVARRIVRRPLAFTVPPWRESVTVVLLYTPTWFLIGGATTAIAYAIDPEVSLTRVMFAAVLSWIAGFVAVPAPGGAGIREAVFTATSGMSPELGATVAVIARVMFIIVDSLGAAIAAPLLRRGYALADVTVADPVSTGPTP